MTIVSRTPLMETARIAQLLQEMGTLLELSGENPFRTRAYHNAAQALESLPSDLRPWLEDGRLAEVSGIGPAIHAKIAQLLTTGQLPALEKLRQETPPGLIALLRVPGLGPKKIKILHESLNIVSLADLRAAAESDGISRLKGFGAKTQAKILEGIAFVEKVSDRILLSQAGRLVEPLYQALKAHRDVKRIAVCGSLRRCAETIGDLDLLISSDSPASVLEAFARLPEVAQVLALGESKASIRLANGVQCDLRGVSDEQFPFALHYFTGSKAHNIAMRKRAIARGLKLSEYGLEGENRWIACRDEAELFATLGLAYLPPESREDQGEIELAETGSLPQLIEIGDLKGAFHNHTDWSDGGNTLEEMAMAAHDRGWSYLGIADHSRSAAYAGGLSIERVRDQWRAIDALNQRYGSEFRILKGIECDILVDGSLDYPDDLLASFDYVVASVHSQFGLSRQAMTERIVRAVRHPLVTMLGHPTGRLLLQREAYAVDLDQVIEAAARSGCMIEINASPYRLDLDAIHCKRAAQLGVRLAINPDAHSITGLDDVTYGVHVARRAGLTRAAVLNTEPLDVVLVTFARKSSRGSSE